MKTVACRSCGAAVLWVTTPKGKQMPLDAEPSSDGTWAFDGDPEERRVSRVAPDYTGEKHVSHFATCPDADTWSKGKRRE